MGDILDVINGDKRDNSVRNTGDIVKNAKKDAIKEDRGEDIVEDNKESMTLHMNTDRS